MIFIIISNNFMKSNKNYTNNKIINNKKIMMNSKLISLNYKKLMFIIINSINNFYYAINIKNLT